MIDNQYLNINNYKAIAIKEGFEIFEADYKDCNINIWGVRSKNRIAGTFDDLMIVFWKYNGVWHQETFKITTDPSDISLINTTHKLGCAIVKKGQYKGIWKLDFHKDRKDHPALRQVKEITVYRDFNKNDVLDIPDVKSLKPSRINTYNYQGGIVKDYYSNSILIYREHRGIFGINCHRASMYQLLQRVGLYSEGCQVHQSYSKYTKEFLPIIKEAVEKWGNKFSYTLINEEDFYE